MEAVSSWIEHYLRIRCPGGEPLKDDAVQEVLLVLHGRDFALPAKLVPNAPNIRRWLRTLVLSRLTDFLRRERVIPKVRCGACLYLSVKNACSLPAVQAPNGGKTPNPHYEKTVDPHQNPSSLVPPCGEFFWRYRRTPLESASSRRNGVTNGLERAELSQVLRRALLLLLRSGPAGRRQAYVLNEHFTGETPATAIAQDLGVSERTIRRDIEGGLKALNRILKEEFGLSEEDFA